MKIVDGLIALLFFAFAAFQYNDPDGTLWLVFYGAVGGVAALAFWGRDSRLLIFVVGAVGLVGLALSAPGFVAFLTDPEQHSLMERMADSRPFIEQSREFLGLCLALAALLFYLLRARKARPRTPPAVAR